MKKSIILVEGPDCSGKSTLINRVKNTLRWDCKSLHHRSGNQFQRYLQEYASSKDMVIDRGHISEEVYSTLWKRETPFSKSEKKILDDIVTEQYLIIFSCPSLDTLQERYRQRTFKQQISLAELEVSRELFLNTMQSFPYISYNSNNYEELDLLVARIEKEVA